MLQYAICDLEMNVSGKIEGLATQKGFEKLLEIHEFGYKVECPKDALSGQSRGRRLHHPCVLSTNAAAPGMPLLFQAATRNEKIKNCKISFFRADDETGKNKCHTTLTLTGGGIAHVRLVLPNVHQAVDTQNVQNSATIPLFVEWSLTFEKMIWSNLDGKKEAQDEWAESQGRS